MKSLYFITDKNIKSHEDKSIKNSRELILKYYDMEQPETFYLDGKQQCTYGKQRSFEDIYILCKTRFPKTTKNIVARRLIKLSKLGILTCMPCSTIHKVTFQNPKNSRWDWSFFYRGTITKHHVNEHGHLYDPSFNDIIKLSEIK